MAEKNLNKIQKTCVCVFLFKIYRLCLSQVLRVENMVAGSRVRCVRIEKCNAMTETNRRRAYLEIMACHNRKTMQPMANGVIYVVGCHIVRRALCCGDVVV